MQKGFSLIEVIFYCFGISLISALILPNAVQYFQRSTMFLETQRLHTELRKVQDSNYSIIAKTAGLDFYQAKYKSGHVSAQFRADGKSYILFEKLYSSDKTYTIFEKNLPSWMKIQSNYQGFIYFDRYGNLDIKPFTITLNRNNSTKKGEKYTVILHNNGRIRADFVDADGK